MPIDFGGFGRVSDENVQGLGLNNRFNSSNITNLEEGEINDNQFGG